MKQLLTRFKEPSSWGGLAAVLYIIAPHIGLAAEGIPQLIQGLSALCGITAFFMPEKK